MHGKVGKVWVGDVFVNEHMLLSQSTSVEYNKFVFVYIKTIPKSQIKSVYILPRMTIYVIAIRSIHVQLYGV